MRFLGFVLLLCSVHVGALGPLEYEETVQQRPVGVSKQAKLRQAIAEARQEAEFVLDWKKKKVVAEKREEALGVFNNEKRRSESPVLNKFTLAGMSKDGLAELIRKHKSRQVKRTGNRGGARKRGGGTKRK